MKIKMIRTQMTVMGVLHAGVQYNVDAKTPAEKTALQHMLDRGFAEEVRGSRAKKEG